MPIVGRMLREQPERHRDQYRISWAFTLAAAYDLIRLRKLLGAAA